MRSNICSSSCTGCITELSNKYNCSIMSDTGSNKHSIYQLAGNSKLSGGCNGSRSNNNTGAPNACGGSTTVTFTYTSSCAPTITTCAATFAVAAAPAVSLS